MTDIKALNTEGINANTAHIDELSILEAVKLINHEDRIVIDVVQNAAGAIAAAINVIVKQLEEGGRLVYFGAGTSGRLGVLDASECPPTFGVSKDLVIGIIAGGDTALRDAVEGAEDDFSGAERDFKALHLTAKDVVCGIAASGRTPYVIGGLNYANSIGVPTISIASVDHAQISELAAYPIEIVTGPEVISGSTRLKAGTATKLTLNIISTTTMIQLGKVYHNLMVDVMPTNVKLVERAKNIIMAATGCNRTIAEAQFEASGHNVKTAITMILLNSSREEAELALAKAKGKVALTLQ